MSSNLQRMEDCLTSGRSQTHLEPCYTQRSSYRQSEQAEGREPVHISKDTASFLLQSKGRTYLKVKSSNITITKKVLRTNCVFYCTLAVNISVKKQYFIPV